MVADAHQGRGIGSVLLEHLAAAARECGVTRFHAVVLAENIAMVRVFRDAGYETTRHLDHGEVTLEFAVDATAIDRVGDARAGAAGRGALDPAAAVSALGRRRRREQRRRQGRARGVRQPARGSGSTARSTRSIPRLVTWAASRRTGRCSTSPTRSTWWWSPYRRRSVPEVVAECASRGVRGLVVTHGGFGERGDDDAARCRARRAARPGRGGAGERHARGRAELPRASSTPTPTVRLNASLAPLAAAARTGRVLRPVRRARRGRAR